MTWTTVSLARAVAPTPHSRRTVRARARRTVHDAYTAIERALDDIVASTERTSRGARARVRRRQVVPARRQGERERDAVELNLPDDTTRRFPERAQEIGAMRPGTNRVPERLDDFNFIVAVALSTKRSRRSSASSYPEIGVRSGVISSEACRWSSWRSVRPRPGCCASASIGWRARIPSIEDAWRDTRRGIFWLDSRSVFPWRRTIWGSIVRT